MDSFGYKWYPYFDQENRAFESCSLVENPTRLEPTRQKEDAFWSGADFGVVRTYRDSLHWVFQDAESTFACSGEDFVACHGKRVVLTVPNEKITSGTRRRWGDEQSWVTPMRDGVPMEEQCDFHVTAKTIFLKPDSHANFYHAMCDFANLYLTLHLLDWVHIDAVEREDFTFGVQHSFVDLEIRMWSDLARNFRSSYLDLFKSFSPNAPVMSVGELKGKRVCYDEMALSMNPRGSVPNFFFSMAVPGRLAPVGVSGTEKAKYDITCRHSGFFRSFLEFITRGNPVLWKFAPALQARSPPSDVPIKVLVLSRSGGTGTTSGTRKLLNEGDVVQAVRNKYPASRVQIDIADFDVSARVPFVNQAESVMSADVLVGMHGAGLTHMLFLPRWGSVVEVFDCEDLCYSDLARLSGLEYYSGKSEDVEAFEPQVEVAESSRGSRKFRDYKVDVDAAVRFIEDAMRSVVEHPLFPKDTSRHGDMFHSSTIRDEL
uniref:EGF domain-specific O-linked N-acetylglucosamine transferase n=1 Tax=Chromera velia CCMP2878 TaxID=1169474 RepID=A0A0G4F0D5_9ALVE|eukprot:Cvel_2574.t1-p1 / transcript=Cvel_2574.t1 / gene=Cvel_2574 / organism=Chromera_velia_CCMP2878 / gene_product=EGF domain-specific O-linked N-acetylglucosamine, putative / transcript_product=EGF domain-specific O-linked N-acetylglucosamine, putative / location=Cvel_scaffold102:15230-16687(-) / protein_length=486 / sequence_SO=supercontig / SO=protein_coding / is_pseudo=false